MIRLLVSMAVLIGGGVSVAGDGPEGDKPTEADLSLYPKVKIETTLGDIVLELNAEKAPVTTTNFIWYAEDGFYDGTIFHRVMKDIFVQGGGYYPNLEPKTEGLRPGIPNEWRNGLKNEQWTIAASRLGNRPDSARSQFVINLVDNLTADEAYMDGSGTAVFGRVVSGFKTLAKIRYAELTSNSKYGGTAKTIPADPILIKSVKVVREYDRKAVEKIAKTHIGRLQQDREKVAQDNTRIVYGLVEEIEKETGAGMTTTYSGLKYVDLAVGEGRVPRKTDTVTVRYTGWLADGTKIQSSGDNVEASTFAMKSAVPGWTEALLTMKVGGKRKLVVPSHLGYGPIGVAGLIPEHAVLVFELELLGIKSPESTTP